MSEKFQADIKYLIQLIAIALFTELVLVIGEVPISEINFNAIFVKRVCIFIFIALVCWLIAKKTERKIGDILFQYRYPFALCILVILVVCDVSGSSIGIWANYFPWEQDNGVLWSIPKAERSDEWAVFTPLISSSFFNPEGKFNYFNSIPRGTLTDSFMVYGQPVLDIAMIFRPFQIGYLFLGMSRGLSFFWWSRLIALFLSTLEVGLLITKKDKRLSVLFATLVAFAPVIHWWFAINSLVEMFVAGNCFILMVYQWIKNTSISKRSLYAFVMGICGGTYILALYPAWMVPLGYLFLALFIWIVYENRDKLSVQKKDVIPLFVFLIVFVGGLAYVFLKSKDTLDIVLNTVYPGKRESVGGDNFDLLFSYVLTVFTGFYSNGFDGAGARCEYSAFMSLYPIGYILAIYTLLRLKKNQKKKDMLLVVTMIFEIILEIFASLEIPLILAKLTLLSWSIPNRVAQMTGVFHIILIIRSITLLKETLETEEKDTVKRWNVIMGVITVVCVGFVVYQATRMQPPYWKTVMVVVSILLFLILFYCILQIKKESIKKVGITFWIVTTIFASVFVNPIQKGIDVIYENPLIKEIQKIEQEDPEAKWLVDNLYYPLINIPIMAGASTINSTNVYPNLDLWTKFDPDGQYDEAYNRYAHIIVNLEKEENIEEKFEFIQFDVFRVKLTLDEIKDIGVRYVLTDSILEDKLDLDTSQYRLCNQFGMYYIYELK